MTVASESRLTHDRMCAECEMTLAHSTKPHSLLLCTLCSGGRSVTWLILARMAAAPCCALAMTSDVRGLAGLITIAGGVCWNVGCAGAGAALAAGLAAPAAPLAAAGGCGPSSVMGMPWGAATSHLRRLRLTSAMGAVERGRRSGGGRARGLPAPGPAS